MNQISVFRGDDKTFNFTFKDGDGAAIDITDWTIYFTAKENVNDTDDEAKIKKDVTVHTAPEGGISNFSLSHIDTDLDPKEYYYDFQIKKDDGIIRTLIKGGFLIHTDITRRIT